MVESIVLGGGCFWCLEATCQLVRGVDKVVPGYAGGTTKNPTYNGLHGVDAGHAEVVQITFDPSVIELSELLGFFGLFMILQL